MKENPATTQELSFEIFRAGDYGDLGKFSEADIDAIVNLYDPKVHHAPIVLGHPETDKPAYGWVEKLRRVGDVIMAKAQLMPEMLTLIKNGLYKKRSAALYTDKNSPGGGLPYLKHVGFLGAVPPIVKGLADITLSEPEGKNVVIEFSDEIEKSIEEAIMPEITFSESQHKAIVDAEVVKKETALRLEFAERETKKDAVILALTAERDAEKAKVEEFAEKALKTEVDGFVDGLLREGKLIPASKEKVSGSLLKLAKVDAALFAEQKAIYAEGPKLIEFGEIEGARGEGDASTGKAEVIAMVGKEAVEKFADVKEFSFGRK